MSQYYNPFGYDGISEEAKQLYFKKQEEKRQKSEIRKISLLMGCAIVAYVVIQQIASTFLLLFDWYDLYLNNSVFQNAFTIICVSFLSVALPFGIMALISKKQYDYPIVPNEPIKPLRCITWICFGMLCCIAANFAVSIVIQLLEEVFKVTFTQGELLDPDSPFACVMVVISTAIIPPICEEFAMRCCSLQLLRKYGKGFAVFAVSIVFGLLHGNVIQFLFAFIIGLVLGFATVKTGSIVPAVLIHAFNNGISAVNSVITYAYNEDTATDFLLIAYALWIVLGLASLVYLIIKGELKKERKAEGEVLTTGQKFTSFLFPWMIVPFVILLIFTAFTIQK